LSAGTPYCLIGANDIYDPRHDWVTPDSVRGRHWIATGGMSNGVAQVVNDVMRQAHETGSIALLRFYGHGAPGLTGVTGGTGGMRDEHGRSICFERANPANRGYVEQSEDGAVVCVTPAGVLQRRDFEVVQGDHVRDRTTISNATMPLVTATLGQLRPWFAAFGSVELHGCHAGGGRQGLRLLGALARTLGVPASAGVDSQSFGHTGLFRFERDVRVVYPGGLSLREWAERGASRHAERGRGARRPDNG
jgi:hypothetical protein